METTGGWINDPRVRALRAAAVRGYGPGIERRVEGAIRAALKRVDRGETRMEMEIRKLEKPLRVW